jgi:predicted Fe-S protein YdhL (DUF1289 family)
VLDGDGYCLGCLRTGDEIGQWRDMSAEQQWRLIERLEERRRHRLAGATSSGDRPPGQGDER